jgi:hypothetical protein
MTFQDDDLRADIQRARAQVDLAETEQAVRARKIGPIPTATVRYRVTLWVLLSYLVYVLLVGAFIVFGNDAAKTITLIDILKTLLFPIVMLVIGFYFGSSKSE